MTAAPAAAREPASPSTSAEEPLRRGLWAVLTYALATLALGWPALAGQFLVGPRSDQYIAGYAFREFAAATLRTTHAFPLWNPYQFGGMPYIAAMHGDIFYPTFLLRMFLPTDVAMTWGFMVHVFLAGALTYLFLRRARFGFAAALIGGLAYMLSAHIATYVQPGHDGKLFVSALFPLLLWTIIAWVRDGRLWAIGAMALVVGLDILTPHPQLLEYSLLTAGAYAIVLAVGVARATGDRKLALVRLGAALGAVVVGLAIGAVQFLPVREYVPWSPRASGIGTYERATSYAKNPQELLNFYLPEFTGILDRYWGPNGIHFQGDYAGVVVLMLAGAGLVGMRRDARARELWFWAVTFVVALLWALGGHTPFYNIPFYLIPGTRYFRAPDSVFFVGTMAMAVFAARGTERVLRGEVSRKYVVGWGIFAAVIALAAVSGVLTAFARSIAPEQRLDAVDANNGSLIVGALRSLVFVLLSGALFLKACSLGRSRRGLPVLLLVLLCAADLWIIDSQYWTFSPPAKVLYASNPAIDYLAHLPQPARVVAIQGADNASVADYDGAGLMAHDVLNTLGYHGNELARYNDLLDIPQGTGPGEDAIRAAIGNSNVRRLTATQYILTNSRDFVTRALPGLTQVAGPAADDPTGRTDYVYRIPGDVNFAWVTPVIVKAPDDAVLATVKNPRFDVTRAALFDTSAKVQAAANVTTLPPATGIATHVDLYAPGRIAISLAAPAPAGSALIVAENFYPGWSAQVDGKPGTVARAQYSMMGVPLPAGARRVTLAFSSPAYERGKLVTWLAILVALAALVAGLVRERRQRV